MYGRITDKTELGLPRSGIRLDGRTVSNYDRLDIGILAAEGWKFCEEIKPAYDEATQYLQMDSAIDAGDKITVTYVAVAIPVDELSAMEDLLLAEMGV